MLKHPQRLLIAACALGGCTSPKPAPALQLRAGVSVDGKCTLSLDGQAVTNDALIRALKDRGSREVHIIGMDMAVPYRCVGPAIAALQRANVPMRIGFISEPPTADTSSPPAN